MFTEPVTLIDETIAHLRGVAELLHDEFDEAIHDELTAQGRICREAYVTIQRLLPQLRLARASQLAQDFPSPPRICVDCE